MKSQQIRNLDPRSGVPTKLWARYWYLLLFLYVGAVLCSVYVRHNLAGEYEQAVAKSQEWSEKFRHYARLGRLMTGVAGFESKTPTQEHLAKTAAQIQEIRDEFERIFLEDKKDLARDTQKEDAVMMLKDLELVKGGMDDLIRNTTKLLSELPNERVTQSDMLPPVLASFHKLLKTFGRLRSRIGGVEAQYFQQQIQAVHMLERMEYVIAFLLFILVGGVSYYGNRLEWQASRDLQEKALLLTQVEAADGKYRALFENASEGIFQIDSRGKFVIVNPALAKMCGYSSPGEFMESITDVGSQFYADPLFWGQFLQDVSFKKAASTWETEVQCRDGNLIWVEQNLHAVEETPGSIAYFEGTLKNITEQKWAELRRTFDYLLPRILAESASVAAAQVGVMQTVCEILDWEMGTAWAADSGQLVLSHIHRQSGSDHRQSGSDHRQSGSDHETAGLFRSEVLALGVEVPAGEGFLGKILSSGEVLWCKNICPEEGSGGLDCPFTEDQAKLEGLSRGLDCPFTEDQTKLEGLSRRLDCDHSPDVRYASAQGLLKMVSLPVKVNGVGSHLLNFFSSKPDQPSLELLRLLSAVTLQLGDLFARKLSEEALRESEALKAAIFESSLDCMITFDEEGLITDFNPAAERTFGYPRQEIIGSEIGRIILSGSFREIDPSRTGRAGIGGSAGVSPGFPPTGGTPALHRPPATDPSRTGGDAGRPDENMMLGRRVELTAVREDRTEFPVEMSVSKIAHNGRSFYTAYIREISDRKRAERVRLELAAVVESSSDAIIGLSPDGNILSWNSGAETMFGYTGPEAIGRHVYILVPPDRIEQSTRNLHALRRGQHLPNHNTVRLRKGGKRFDVSITESPIRNSSGAISGISLIARDITDNKMLQEQFLQSQKMEAVGTLAGGIAHDFNNILTAIIGYSDLTLRQVNESVPFHKNLLGIKASAEFAATLTHQLLAFSRRQTLELSIFPVNNSVTRIEKLLHRLIGENINIITSLSEGAGRIKADLGQMEQVIMNLAVNARDAMPKGGVLTLETGNIRVDESDLLTGLTQGHYVRLSVSDTGHGMTEEVREHLFEPFFTTKDKGKGTGLGLATCYGIIKQIGGHIVVESTPGEGTTFNLYFPRVSDSEESSKQQLKKIGIQPKGTETVLLVEDEETVRQLSADVLRRLGYQVIEAHDCDSARAIILERNGAIDLLLSDVVLPNSSGKELAEWAGAAYKDMKVLLMSGYLEDSILKNHGLSTDDAFLQKPFSPSGLAQKVREVMDSPQPKML